MLSTFSAEGGFTGHGIMGCTFNFSHTAFAVFFYSIKYVTMWCNMPCFVFLLDLVMTRLNSILIFKILDLSGALLLPLE